MAIRGKKGQGTDGANMLCLGFSTIYRKANEWGPYCVADIDMKEVK